jgi:hypothetical protein
MPSNTMASVANTELMECYIAELVTDMGAGAGETNCFECSGTGEWPWHPCRYAPLHGFHFRIRSISSLMPSPGNSSRRYPGF